MNNRRDHLRALSLADIGEKKQPNSGAAAMKYRNRPTAGFHSKAEAMYAAELELRKKAIGVDRIADYKTQVSIRLEVNGVLICRYVADFLVEFPNGKVELHEVKGLLTPEARIKMALYRALFPERTLVVIDAGQILKRNRANR
jgi:hypothetical protein